MEVLRYAHTGNNFSQINVHHHDEESNYHWKSRTFSSSSSDTGSSVGSTTSTQITSDEVIIEKDNVPEFYEIEMIFWTKNDGDEDMCEIGEWKQVIQRHTQAERIVLDCSVFGQEVVHLMPTTSKGRPELQKDFHELQAMIGLPFDKNGNPAPSAALGRQTISAVFGCNDFPSDFMGKTLKAWRENSKTLEFVSISWRTPVKNREDVIAKMAQKYELPLTHAWKFSKHKESMYALAYFDDEEEKMQKENKDSVNIYILYPKHENHTAILSVSNYALTLHCAFRQAPSAALGRQTISAVFGCNDFPSDFMGKTLKAWRENSKTLEFVSISWRTPVKNREDVIAKMAQKYELPLTHAWKFSKHKESMYALAYFDDEEEKMQKENKDSVNIYILYPKHENHTAILSVSNYALTLHCAFRQGREAVPILKQAFNNATQIKDTFFQIFDDRINKEVPT